MKDIIIYTDGACKNNPGPGGYAAIIAYDNEYITNKENIVKQIVSGEKETTNNIMELTAILKSLEYVYGIITKEGNKEKIEKSSLKILLYSDSEYSLNGINVWHINWEKKNFKNVKNAEIWKSLLDIKRKIEKVDRSYTSI